MTQSWCPQDPDTWILDQIPSTLVGAWLPCRLEVTESHRAHGHLAVYCKRHWDNEMKESRDYGDSRCSKADAFIEEHQEEWKSQSQRALPDTSEPEEVDTDGEDEIDEDEGRDMGTDEAQTPGTYAIENTPLAHDYHDSLRFLYAFPDERAHERHPILIRREYVLLYDEMKALHKRRRIAILTRQPGIGKTDFLTYVLWRLLGEGKSVY
ncbi:hypothetical protein VTN96DRAFT_9723 [Rasamsonia emersonii]